MDVSKIKVIQTYGDKTEKDFVTIDEIHQPNDHLITVFLKTKDQYVDLFPQTIIIGGSHCEGIMATSILNSEGEPVHGKFGTTSLFFYISPLNDFVLEHISYIPSKHEYLLLLMADVYKNDCRKIEFERIFLEEEKPTRVECRGHYF